MKQIILYGSRYGSTEQYAKELSKRTGVECCSYNQCPKLNDYDTIVYMGSLFGGRVNGLKKTAKHFPKSAKLILVTTGILDITVKDNYEHVKKTSLTQLPSDMVSKTSVHCLMGKSVYATMKWTDKLVMSIVHKGLSQKPDSERTENEKIFINNFKTIADMMDFDSLNPIIEEMK